MVIMMMTRMKMMMQEQPQSRARIGRKRFPKRRRNNPNRPSRLILCQSSNRETATPRNLDKLCKILERILEKTLMMMQPNRQPIPPYPTEKKMENERSLLHAMRSNVDNTAVLNDLIHKSIRGRAKKLTEQKKASGTNKTKKESKPTDVDDSYMFETNSIITNSSSKKTTSAGNTKTTDIGKDSAGETISTNESGSAKMFTTKKKEEFSTSKAKSVSFRHSTEEGNRENPIILIDDDHYLFYEGDATADSPLVLTVVSASSTTGDDGQQKQEEEEEQQQKQNPAVVVEDGTPDKADNESAVKDAITTSDENDVAPPQENDNSSLANKVDPTKDGNVGGELETKEETMDDNAGTKPDDDLEDDERSESDYEEMDEKILQVRLNELREQRRRLRRKAKQLQKHQKKQPRELLASTNTADQRDDEDRSDARETFQSRDDDGVRDGDDTVTLTPTVASHRSKVDEELFPSTNGHEHPLDAMELYKSYHHAKKQRDLEEMKQILGNTKNHVSGIGSPSYYGLSTESNSVFDLQRASNQAALQLLRQRHLEVTRLQLREDDF
mmetsp:Transcript_15190/g.26335  ORF Transcript_15190/g.26335 Transcript_15190/m.26335 type:complete len:556 (-) Transcript_15190:168-1835(-)